MRRDGEHKLLDFFSFSDQVTSASTSSFNMKEFSAFRVYCDDWSLDCHAPKLR